MTSVIWWDFFVPKTIQVLRGNLLPLIEGFPMQESFDISSSTGNYNVVLGINLLDQVIAQHNSAIFMIDERLENVLPATVTKRILIKANETSKSLECMPEVILKMRELGANRTSHLV